MAHFSNPIKGSGGPKRKINLAQLAQAKALPAAWLKKELGLHDLPGGGVGIPYFDASGAQEIAVKKRTRIVAKEGSYWPKDLGLAAYGQWRLDRAQRAGFLILVEGESDCWTLWHYGLPALGIPGANAAKVLDAEHVDGLAKVYII